MGKLFVIEGTDSSGKQTQLEKLKNRFEKENIKYKSVSFPNYESNSSELVKIYLKGELGDDPKILFFLLHLLFSQLDVPYLK